MKNSLIAALAAAAFAAACTHSTGTSGVASFGQSAESNLERQVTSGPADARPPEGGGSQGALAQMRYRTGTTKPLRTSSASVSNPSAMAN